MDNAISASEFVERFQRLLLEKPRYNLKHVMAENCDYSDTAVKSKNCYYGFGTFYCEDVYYARYSRKCSGCSGLTLCAGCEWCVECVDCVNCYMADYCQDCSNCRECQYCKDCFGCSNCFGCVGLYQKKFCIFNEQFSEAKFKERMKKLNFHDSGHRTFVLSEVEKLRAKAPNMAVHQFQTENCVGDHISESGGCYQCYDIFASEDCLYNIEANANKECCDITVCFESEFCYQCVQSPLCNNCNFLVHVDSSGDSEFCAFSRNLRNCFGCVYLEHKEYHILNEPYSREEYERIVPLLREELMAFGRYNFDLYLASDYERERIKSETEPVIAVAVPNL